MADIPDCQCCGEGLRLDSADPRTNPAFGVSVLPIETVPALISCTEV